MIDRLFRLVGGSRAQKDARDMLLALKPLPTFKSCFDSTSSADLEGVMELLRQVEDLEQVLRPWPASKSAGPFFSIEQGHTLELRLGLDGEGRKMGHEPGTRYRLCITRLGADLWAWYLDGTEVPSADRDDAVRLLGLPGLEPSRPSAQP